MKEVYSPLSDEGPPQCCRRCFHSRPEATSWCEFCHPVVADQLHAHCSQPALCVGAPGYTEEPPDPKVLALLAEMSKKRQSRRRVRFVTGSVEDAPVQLSS